MEQDADVKRKGSSHPILSESPPAPRPFSPRRQLSSGGFQTEAYWLEGKHSGAKCGCRQSGIHFRLGWRTEEAAATRGSVDLDITAATRWGRSTLGKPNLAMPGLHPSKGGYVLTLLRMQTLTQPRIRSLFRSTFSSIENLQDSSSSRSFSPSSGGGSRVQSLCRTDAGLPRMTGWGDKDQRLMESM